MTTEELIEEIKKHKYDKETYDKLLNTVNLMEPKCTTFDDEQNEDIPDDHFVNNFIYLCEQDVGGKIYAMRMNDTASDELSAVPANQNPLCKNFDLYEIDKNNDYSSYIHTLGKRIKEFEIKMINGPSSGRNNFFHEEYDHIVIILKIEENYNILTFSSCRWYRTNKLSDKREFSTQINQDINRKYFYSRTSPSYGYRFVGADIIDYLEPLFMNKKDEEKEEKEEKI